MDGVSLTGLPAWFAERVITLINVPPEERDETWQQRYRAALTRLKHSVTTSDPTEDEYERIARLDGPALVQTLRTWERDVLRDLPRKRREA